MSRTVLMRALGYLGGVLAIVAGVYRLSQADEAGAAVAFGIGFSLLGVTDLVGRLAEKLKAVLPDWIGLDDLIDRLLERLAERPDGPLVVAQAAPRLMVPGTFERVDSEVIVATPVNGTVILDSPDEHGVPGGLTVKHADTGADLLCVEVYGMRPGSLEYVVKDGQAVTAGDILIERVP